MTSCATAPTAIESGVTVTGLDATTTPAWMMTVTLADALICVAFTVARIVVAVPRVVPVKLARYDESAATYENAPTVPTLVPPLTVSATDAPLPSAEPAASRGTTRIVVVLST